MILNVKHGEMTQSAQIDAINSVEHVYSLVYLSYQVREQLCIAENDLITVYFQESLEWTRLCHSRQISALSWLI